MQIDLTEIIVALIGVLGTIITVHLIPYLKSKLTANQQAELQKWVKVGVAAAEQLSKTGVIKKAERKKYVLEFLESHGFTADLDKVEELIEAAVYELPGKLTNTEVKKLAEQKVVAMAEETVDKKVEEVVQTQVEKKVDTTIHTAVESAVGDKLSEVVKQEVQQAVAAPIVMPPETSSSTETPRVNQEDIPPAVNYAPPSYDPAADE